MKRALLLNVMVIAAVTSDTVIDRQGFLSALVGASVTAADENAEITYKLQHCDTADGTFADVTDTQAFVDGNGGAVAADSISNVDIDLLGCKRYIKVIPTASEGVTAAYAVALGDKDEMPV